MKASGPVTPEEGGTGRFRETGGQMEESMLPLPHLPV